MVAAEPVPDENAEIEPSFSDSEYNYVDSASDEGNLYSFMTHRVIHIAYGILLL